MVLLKAIAIFLIIVLALALALVRSSSPVYSQILKYVHMLIK